MLKKVKRKVLKMRILRIVMRRSRMGIIGVKGEERLKCQRIHMRIMARLHLSIGGKRYR